jgi:hypothetical protein
LVAQFAFWAQCALSRAESPPAAASWAGEAVTGDAMSDLNRASSFTNSWKVGLSGKIPGLTSWEWMTYGSKCLIQN